MYLIKTGLSSYLLFFFLLNFFFLKLRPGPGAIKLENFLRQNFSQLQLSKPIRIQLPRKLSQFFFLRFEKVFMEPDPEVLVLQSILEEIFNFKDNFYHPMYKIYYTCVSGCWLIKFYHKFE